ncbi:hypothetical protein ACB092_08G063500 [Castanea dentata]
MLLCPADMKQTLLLHSHIYKSILSYITFFLIFSRSIIDEGLYRYLRLQTLKDDQLKINNLEAL